MNKRRTHFYIYFSQHFWTKNYFKSNLQATQNRKNPLEVPLKFLIRLVCSALSTNHSISRFCSTELWNYSRLDEQTQKEYKFKTHAHNQCKPWMYCYIWKYTGLIVISFLHQSISVPVDIRFSNHPVRQSIPPISHTSVRPSQPKRQFIHPFTLKSTQHPYIIICTLSIHSSHIQLPTVHQYWSTHPWIHHQSIIQPSTHPLIIHPLAQNQSIHSFINPRIIHLSTHWPSNCPSIYSSIIDPPIINFPAYHPSTPSHPSIHPLPFILSSIHPLINIIHSFI